MRRIIYVIILTGLLVGRSSVSAKDPDSSTSSDDFNLLKEKEGYHLRPAAATVKAGGTVRLNLVFCTVEKQSGDISRENSDDKSKEESDDDELAPLVPITPDNNSKRKYADDDLNPLVPPPSRLACEDDDGFDALYLLVPPNVTWKVVAGQGSVSVDKTGATYHAPARKPTPNEATVEATVTYNWEGKKRKEILRSYIEIIEPARQYEGKVTFSQSGKGHSITLAGNVTWTELDGGSNTFVPSGSLKAKISMEGCNPYTGSVGISGGEMYFDVPADGRYRFTLGTYSVTLSCNGIGVPYAQMIISPPCDGQPGNAPLLGNQKHLEGSGNCNKGNLTWSFVQQ